MERLRWTNSIVLSTVFALAIQLVATNSVMAQAPNTTMAQDDKPIRIVDSKNNTIGIIDPKTHQTVNVTGNLTLREVFGQENTTINETLTTDTGNATTDETLTTDTGNATTDETLTTDTGNATTEINLTDKFETLQGK